MFQANVSNAALELFGLISPSHLDRCEVINLTLRQADSSRDNRRVEPEMTFAVTAYEHLVGAMLCRAHASERGSAR